MRALQQTLSETFSECGENDCCAVLFADTSRGAHCDHVPIWNFANWIHPGGSFVTNSDLCNTVRYGWLGKGSHSSQGVNPQDLSLNRLQGGASTQAGKMGIYRDPSCPPLPTPSPPPESPPPPPIPTSPPRPPGACDSSYDVIVVGAGAGGAAAAAFLIGDGRPATLVLSDGPDRSEAVSSASLDDTLYNRFGQLSQRAIPNVAKSGAGWVQVEGAGGNNAHNGGVHSMPSPFQLDALLGMDGRALQAATWLAAQPGLSSLAATPTSACADRDPSNLTAFYLEGPLGCSPIHRYATCSDTAACVLEANVASSVTPSLSALATGLRKTTMYSDLLKPAAAAASTEVITIRHGIKGERVLWDGDVARAVQLDVGMRNTRIGAHGPHTALTAP